MNNYIPYPYPVLGNDDDVNGRFVPSMTYSLDPINVSLNIKFTLENDYIKSLIEDGRASFLIDIACNRTYFRKSIKTNDFSVIYEEPANNLRGRVDVSFYICTNEPIGQYSPNNNEAYFVECGDIIAVGGSASFSAEKEYDPLKAPIKSIIKITCLDKSQDEFTVLYNDDEFITIGIPKDMYSLYTSACSGSAAEMLHASIVLPALMDAIDAVKDGNSEVVNTAWALKLNELCASRGIALDEDSKPLAVAQKLLHNPTKRALDWYNKNNEAEDE